MLCWPRTRREAFRLIALCRLVDWFLALAVARPFAFSVLVVLLAVFFDPVFDLLLVFALPLVGARCTRDANADGTIRAAERIITKLERDKNTIMAPQ